MFTKKISRNFKKHSKKPSIALLSPQDLNYPAINLSNFQNVTGRRIAYLRVPVLRTRKEQKMYTAGLSTNNIEKSCLETKNREK